VTDFVHAFPWRVVVLGVVALWLIPRVCAELRAIWKGK